MASGPILRDSGRGGAGLALILALGGCGFLAGAPAPDPAPDPAPASTAPAAADTVAAGDPPAFRVQISDQERARLVTQATSDLEAARATASLHPDPAGLPAEARRQWETLAHYIELAESFLDAGDAQAASDVALKARLLARELDPD